MLHPQRKTMDLVPLVCLCLLTWSAGTAADHSPPVIKLVVMETSDAILPCSLGTSSIKEELFDWKRDRQEVFLYDTRDEYNNGRPGQDPQFKGRVFHFPEAVQLGNASIVIRNTQVSDSGNYTCDFPRHQPQRRSRIELLIGAAAEPSVRLVKTDDGMLLQCVVKGASPQPKVEWKDSAGNILPAKKPQVTERGGSYDVILQATVTKTDTFTCVVTQKEINHQISADTDAVPLNAATGLVVGVSVPIVLLVVGLVLVETEL